MKRFLTIAAALALVLGLSQCRKPNAPTINGLGTTQHVTLTSSFGGDGSKLGVETVSGLLNLKWQVGDKIKISAPNSGELECTSASYNETTRVSTGTFEGDITYHSGDITFTVGTEPKYLEQDGGEINEDKIYLVGTSEYKSDRNYNVSMQLPYAILKLDLSYLGSTSKADDGATVTVKVDGNEIAKIINVKDSSTEMYVALPNNYPNTEKAYVFSSTNGKNLTFTWTLDGNTFFTAAGTQGGSIKPVETDEWINFNDEAMGVTGMPIWAKKNLGATNGSTAQSWYGDYYAWGEVAPYYTSITWTAYDEGSAAGWKTDMTTGAGNTVLTNGYAWTSYSKGAVDDFEEWSTPPYGSDYVLTQACDAAYQNATPANTWRMPIGGASSEWIQLVSNTYFRWVYGYNGIEGLNGFVVYKVKDAADKGLMTMDVNYSPDAPEWVTKNQNLESATVQGSYAASDPHMFLPAAGDFGATDLEFAGSFGNYWSSSLYSDYYGMAWYMRFSSGSVGPWNLTGRFFGFSVRPVQ